MTKNIQKAVRVGCAVLSLFVISVASDQNPANTAPSQTDNNAATTAANATPAKSPAQLAGLYVYPQKNQDSALQSKDEGECFDSAKQNTGFDPAAPQAATSEESAKGPKGGGVKGGAKGAAGGAAIGAIAGDAGTGAAIGAVAGGVGGRRRQKKEKKEAEKEAQQSAQSAQNQQLDGFRRAMSACLDARGYSVK